MRWIHRPSSPPAALRGDLIAGVTLWAVFAAQALAYAQLAHASAAAGLATAIGGALIYAALGSSRRISVARPAGSPRSSASRSPACRRRTPPRRSPR